MRRRTRQPRRFELRSVETLSYGAKPILRRDFTFNL